MYIKICGGEPAIDKLEGPLVGVVHFQLEEKREKMPAGSKGKEARGGAPHWRASTAPLKGTAELMPLSQCGG